MINDEENILIEDIIDKMLFEYILGLLSSYTGCASFTMSKNHEEIYSVNSTNFCDNVFRKTECGAKACKECDEKYCKLAAKTGETQLYKCSAGIYTSAIPIFDGKDYLGAIMCGQVLFEEPDLELCKQKAKEYGIDEKTYIDAYKEIPVVDEVKFKEALKQANSFCKAISNLAKAKKIEQTQDLKEDFVITLLNSINNKMDLKKTLSSVISKAAELFDVDRILVVDFSSDVPEVEIDYFTPNSLKEEEIKAIKKEEEQEWVLNEWKKEFNNKGTISINNVALDDSLSQNLKVLYYGFGLKSALSTIIKTEGAEKVLILENFTKISTWTKRDKSFLNIVSKEITAALIQASLTKEIEKQLSIQNTLVNNVPFEMWMKNIYGQYISVNDVWLKDNNMKKEDAIGNIDDNIFPPERAERYKKEDAEILYRKEPFSKEYTEKHGDKVTWQHKYLSPILDNQNNVIGLTGFKRDITEYKEVEKRKTEFVSTVSHELRTPLTSIIGGLSLALSGAVGEISPRVKTVLDISSNNSKRLLALINDILDIEKLSAGKMIYNYEVIELCKTIDEATKGIEDFAKKYNVNINYNVELCGTLFLKVDKSRFVQILINLLSNAIKYSDEGKDVEVYANDLPTDKIRISVVNYGPEVSEDFRRTIFDRFAQENSSQMRKNDSTGLGLSITKELVNDMGGTIDFVSKNGKTVFYVEFDKVIEE